MEAGESDKTSMRSEILQYLQRFPDAADSLNGIINWWLPGKYKDEDVSKVEEVLEQLIAEGVVRKVFLIDKTVLYKRKEKWD